MSDLENGIFVEIRIRGPGDRPDDRERVFVQVWEKEEIEILLQAARQGSTVEPGDFLPKYDEALAKAP